MTHLVRRTTAALTGTTLTGTALTGTALTGTVLLALAAPAAAAGGTALPPAPTARDAAAAATTLDTLSRFFAARDGAAPGAAKAAARPRIEGAPVPVHVLSPEFVAGRPGAPVARVEFHASRAVAQDGRKASVWTVRQGAGWQVVNIATGDDEIRYAEQGTRRLPGGTVFREPQIDAWYVHKGGEVLPLDPDAVRAVGANGTTLAAYRARVTAAYGDKLPGSAYAGAGRAGGYDHGPAGGRAAPPRHGAGPVTAASTGPAAAPSAAPVTAVSATAAAFVAAALTALRLRRRRTA
ncbi:hypothetical protein ACFPM3_31455 [Streptomyces coeruleoprunus]|uniref:Uncharacterized protein n=1 Tax=Streptomyces coeruleoprunus TaxID=285563 RepID=A0ABV9XQI9_9ACTN